MRVIRIHVDTPLRTGAEVVLPPAAAAHVTRVLRLRAGDALTLFNGDGCDYSARLTVVGAHEASARVESSHAASPESPLRITLAQALARGEKMDWIVQKATELGVAAIVPLVTERSEVKLDGARAAKRVEHWRAVGIGACEQSGRGVIPAIAPPQALDSWLASLNPEPGALRLMLHPGDALRPRALHAPAQLVLLAGPEGGLGSTDLASLQAAGFTGMSLGPRILRTETAGVAAVAALQALFGDF